MAVRSDVRREPPLLPGRLAVAAVRKLLPFLWFAALCAACAPPPFDLTLSRTAATMKKLTQDNPSLITVDHAPTTHEGNYRYYPQVTSTGFGYGDGFFTATEDLSVRICAVRYDPVTGVYKEYAYRWEGLPNPDPQAPPYLAWPVKTGASYFFAVGFDSYAPGQNGYAVLKGDSASHTLSPVEGGSASNKVSRPPLSFPSPNAVIGVSRFPIDAGHDLAHWLMRDIAGRFDEASFQLDQAGLTAAARLRPSLSPPYQLLFIPSWVTRCMYFHDENPAGDPTRLPNRSFASWYDTGSQSWVCQAWEENPSGTLVDTPLPIDHRIDALLSTGALLSTEGGTGRLYTRDGTLTASFPMGNLVLLGEWFASGEARTWFSQCLIYENRLHFNVFWIKTGNLAALGG
jgi:hypothetical protein